MRNLAVVFTFCVATCLLHAQSGSKEWNAGPVVVIGADESRAEKALSLVSVINNILGSPSEWSALPLSILFVDQLALSRFDQSSHLASFFLITNDRAFIVLGPDAKGPEVVHEYIHYLASVNQWRSEPWFHEGLAVALATLEQTESATLMASNRYDGLRCGGSVELDTLLSSQDFHQGSLNESRLRYRSAGRLLNFLLHKRGLDATLKFVNTSVEPIRANDIAGFLALSSESLRHQFSTYCGETVSIPVRTRHVRTQQQNISAGRLERELGALMARWPSLAGKAEKGFLAQIERDPTDLTARSNLAVAYATQGKFDSAMTEFDRLPKAAFQGNGLSAYRELACNGSEKCDSSEEQDEESVSLSVEVKDTSNVWGCDRGCDWRSTAQTKAVKGKKP